jgi:hypothetical protein
MTNFLRHCLKTTPVLLLFSLSCVGQSATIDRPRSDTTKQEKYLSKTESDSLATVLLRIGQADQQDRNQLEQMAAQFGGDSPQMKALFGHMKQTDSLNFMEVNRILTRYGWLSPSSIGPDANRTLFMVIQHADLAAQEKYVLMMTQAVKEGSLKAASFALFQDRMALRKGQKQIYGSQVAWNMKTNHYYVMAIENPDQVDLRRAKVGLVPIAVYLLDCCNVVWDLAAYKENIYSLKAKK